MPFIKVVGFIHINGQIKVQGRESIVESRCLVLAISMSSPVIVLIIVQINVFKIVLIKVIIVSINALIVRLVFILIRYDDKY